MKTYKELKASQVTLLSVKDYLEKELLDVTMCTGTPESKWFEGQRMTLEDAIVHVDRMIDDVCNELVSL